ncbi:MAG: hypothetical protein Fues2KO_27070 [Fuerstiella sp.]
MNQKPATDQPLQAIAFDAVGTVMYPTPGVADAYRAAIERHFECQIDVEQIRTATRTALRQRSETSDLRTDEAAERRFWADLVEQLCPPGQPEKAAACFEDLFAHFAEPGHWACFPEVETVIPRLQAAGLKVALASNFDTRLNAVCDGLAGLSDIPHRIISSVVGFRKPAPEFFHAVVEKLQVPPQQILFVGDDRVNDVDGAAAAGMQTAWVVRTGRPESVPLGCRLLSTLSDLLPQTAPSTSE